MVSLTAADRKWMDDIVHTVEETWGRVSFDVPDIATKLTRYSPMESARRMLLLDALPQKLICSFRGSDDDLRARFEEYICAALSSVKYSDFLQKGKAGDIAIVGVGKLSFSHRTPV